MPNTHRFIPVELRPYEWEIIVASVLYALKLVKADSDMRPFLRIPRILALVESMEHQIACDEDEHAAQD